MKVVCSIAAIIFLLWLGWGLFDVAWIVLAFGHPIAATGFGLASLACGLCVVAIVSDLVRGSK